MNPVSTLLTVLWIYTGIFILLLIADIFKHRKAMEKNPVAGSVFISIIANFFDTLGIGSFATATSAWKLTGTNSDDLIPGTLNVAFAIPTAVEATIFFRSINMVIPTLIIMIAASVIGASISAKLILRLNISRIRIVIGAALLAVAAVTLCKINAVGPFGIIGTAKGLDGKMLLAAILGNLFLGALMPAGVGLYAPCMALILLLGMSADAAFPVMMGSCAFLMPSAGISFIKEGRYHRKSAIPMSLGGTLGVLAAGTVVTALPLTLMTYLACVVMVICAGMFFHDAWKHSRSKAARNRRPGFKITASRNPAKDQ